MRLPTRSALVRLARIDAQIRAGDRPNANTLAKLLEVNPRTIQRDLDCLRDQLSAPIEYDKSSHGYVYTDTTYRLPMPQVSEGECLALFLAERLFQQYRHADLAADLERLFQKIAALLPDGVSLHLEELARAYSLRVNATDPGDLDRFRLLLRAVRDGQQLELNYWSASRDETRRRIVDPYHLAAIDGDWYMIGYCHLREDVRMFAPARIRDLRETGERFDRPDDFRADDYLDAGFRKMRGAGPPQTIRLRFTAVAARFVREKTWHPTQKLEDQADGGAILTFRVNHLAEVRRWVMSFGAECAVLEPEELQSDILNEITRMQHQTA
jgi:predicted DNA-binding transcriptional regulator YafY